MVIKRQFTEAGKDPFSYFEYERGPVYLRNELILADAEFPKHWSEHAKGIFVDKFFRKKGVPQPDGKLGGETSVKQTIGRIVKAWHLNGQIEGYFTTYEDFLAFYDEMVYMMVGQYASPNSPQYFNTGLYESYNIERNAPGYFADADGVHETTTRPQTSACFIVSVKDDLIGDDGIYDLLKTEAQIFKFGSGSGTNFSNIRAEGEPLSGGGKSSGVKRFLEVLDKSAGAIKSGGTTRRAAKMIVFDADHPDILSIIKWKRDEEIKARALSAAGYDGGFEGEAINSVSGQNANISIRLTGDFFKEYESELATGAPSWQLRNRTDSNACKVVSAVEIFDAIVECAHESAEPGLHFADTINANNTCASDGEIRASNPCVTGDTLINTGRGLRRIDSMVGVDYFTEGLNNNFYPAHNIAQTGEKEVYLLETKSGYSIKLTADHLVWTENRGDVKAIELTKDDVIKLSIGSFGNDSCGGEDIALLIGLFIGDGCVGADNGCQLTVGGNHKEICEVACDTINKIKLGFGKTNKSNVCKRQNNVYACISNCGAVSETLTQFAELSAGSENKNIKPNCFLLKKEEQSALLRGIFTTDGTVANYGDKAQYVALDSTSLSLIRNVQLMLLNFGIKSKIYKNRRAGKTTCMLPDGKGGIAKYNVKEIHSLRISKSNRFLFEKEIGFMKESYKFDKLSDMNKGHKSYSDNVYDYVESITHIGTEKVYDLTEPNTNHFFANGIAVHNCSEYLFLDDTACNLASLNLLKFLYKEGKNIFFNDVLYKHAVRLWTIALDISVGMSCFPTKKIAQGSYDYRTLGLGYTNLGASLMAIGVSYDSDWAVKRCETFTKLMYRTALETSIELGKELGSFPRFEANKAHCKAVIAAKAPDIEVTHLRNAQLTLLAPTGTIAFVMDCDTTGIEPHFELTMTKNLAGGGTMKIESKMVRPALEKLEYNEKEIDAITNYLVSHKTIIGAPHLKPEHYAVFQCANCDQPLSTDAHLNMMAAAQKYLCGAISKTVNLPQTATREDVKNVYLKAYKMGIKCLSIYVDNSKMTQPLQSKTKPKAETTENANANYPTLVAAQPTETVLRWGQRKPFAKKRKGVTETVKIGGAKVHFTINTFEDGAPCELFIEMKASNTFIAMLDLQAKSISHGLQYGVPLEKIASDLCCFEFAPNGFTDDAEIRTAKSIFDYIGKVLLRDYSGKPEPQSGAAPAPILINALSKHILPCVREHGGGKLCEFVPNGKCLICENCGETTGCS